MPRPLHAAVSRRAFLRASTQSATLLAFSGGTVARVSGETISRQGAPIDSALNRLIEQYMRAMYAPGLTLGLVYPDGHTAATVFGFSDVARQQPVTPAMLFQIGSISKSFCALALLQMQDEGKLDVSRPILDYLPWLPLDTPLGAITVHHLLTHSAGLPDNTPLFLPDRGARLLQTFKPGSQFHYCNLGFDILGHLAAALDQTSYASVLQRRLLTPLGMRDTLPAISSALLERESKSYVIRRGDLSAGRDAPLEVAPRRVFTNAAGCIASTPADMAVYMTMLLRRGAGPNGRIVSEKAFAQFATPHVEAEEFGKGAQYGYGIAVATEDGHTVLRHTGGMESFASSMQVDLDGHMAAFASINAMQGYRPNPVTKFALQVMRAEAEKKPVPPPDPIDDPRAISNAAEYAGAYTGPRGSIEVLAQASALFARVRGEQVRLSRSEGDSFVAADDPKWQEFSWNFARASSDKPGANTPVTELSYGPDWYANAAYTGARQFTPAEHLRPFAGYYSSDDGETRVYFVKSELTLDGTPLVELGGGLFRVSGEPNSPETVEFLHIIDGRARLLVFDGSPLWRVETT